MNAVALILLCGLVAAEDKAPPSQPTTLDVTKPLGDLPAVGADSTPDAVADAIQGRLDFLHLRKLSGRVVLPEGKWVVNRPLFLNGDGMELVGAGVGKTILEAADGFRAMPMVNLGTRTYFPERPLQPCNRVLLTDPKNPVFDDSVHGSRYGLRTCTEYPSDHFPAVTHRIADPAAAKPWAKGAAYEAGDAALVNAPPMPRPLACVCVKKHTAAQESEPLRGADWKDYWVAKLPYHVQFLGDPLSAGAFDPAVNRAGGWASMDAFTLDFAFTLNAPPGDSKDARTLCGLAPTGWALVLTPDGRLTFRAPLTGGKNLGVDLAKGCTAAGSYRLALQVDFAAHAVDAWLRKPGENDFARTLADRKSLPDGPRFRPTEYTYFTIAGPAEQGSGPASGNNSLVPLDMTVCGLHTSASVRYADADALRRKDDGRATDDDFRYFGDGAGTLAYLPLTENPPVEGTQTQAMLVTERHGPAAGGAGQSGYGYFKSPAGIYGVGRPRLSGLTIRQGPTWGVGVVNWNTLDATLHDLDVRGGYYAVGDLFLGAQYTFDVRDCVLSGSEAGWCGMSNILYFRNVTFGPVGRCGLLLSGCNCMADDIHFSDPRTFHSQYYFRHLGTVQYGGMNLLAGVTAEAPDGCAFPSEAAFSQASVAGTRTSIVVRGARVRNLGPDAAFLELGPFQRPGPCLVRLEDCDYNGKPIAAMVRAAAPWWDGEVAGCDTGACKRLLDYRPEGVPAWQAGRKYARGEAAMRDGKVYECRKEHHSDPDSAPDADKGRDLWRLRVPTIVFTGTKSEK